MSSDIAKYSLGDTLTQVENHWSNRKLISWPLKHKLAISWVLLTESWLSSDLSQPFSWNPPLKISASGKDYSTVSYHIYLPYVKINFQRQRHLCMLTQSCDRANPIYNYPSRLPKVSKNKLHFMQKYIEVMSHSFSVALGLNDSSSGREMKERKFCLSNTDLVSRKTQFIFECRGFFTETICWLRFHVIKRRWTETGTV